MISKIKIHLALERNVLIMATTAGAIFLTRGFWSPFMPLYMRTLGAGEPQIGLIYSTQFLSYVLVSVPFGYLADSVGRKKMIVIGTFLLGLTTTSYALAPNWQWLLVAAVSESAFHAAYIGALYAIIADSVKPSQRAMAFASLYVIGGVLSAPGPTLGGYLYQAVFKSYKPLFLISGTVFIFMALFRLFTLRETILKVISLKKSIRRLKRNLPNDFKYAILGDRSRSAFLLCSSIGALSFGILGGGLILAPAYLTLYAKDIIGLNEWEIGVWQSLGSVSWLLFQFPCAKLSDRFGRKVALILSGLVIFPWVFGFMMSRDLLQATLFGGVLSSLSGALYVSSHSALIADLTPVKSRAMVMSVFTAVNSLAQAPGPISGGFMYERLSPQSPLLASVLAYIPSLLVLLLFVKEPKHKSR